MAKTKITKAELRFLEMTLDARRLEEKRKKAAYMKDWHARHPKVVAAKPVQPKESKVQVNLKVTPATLTAIKALVTQRGVTQYQLLEELVVKALFVHSGFKPNDSEESPQQANA
jgi:predicted DNA binding CopG/RHH family protein